MSIYQTFDWTMARWRWMGTRDPLRITTVWDGERLVGVFPVYVDSSRRTIRTPGTAMRFAGRTMGEHPDVVAPGYEEPVAEVLVGELLRTPGWNHLDLQAVPADSRFNQAFLLALRRRGSLVYLISENPANIIPLPATWDEYMTRVRPRARREVLKKMERLDRAGAKIELAGADLPVETGIEEFIRLHRCRGRARGWTTYEDPATRRFLTAVVTVFHEAGATRLMFLRVGGERIAGALTFLYRPTGVAYGYQCGMAPGAWASCSPGIIVRFNAIRDAIACGMRAYDILEGNEPYKELFAPTTSVNRRYLVSSPRMGSKAWITAWWCGRRLLRSIRVRRR